MTRLPASHILGLALLMGPFLSQAAYQQPSSSSEPRDSTWRDPGYGPRTAYQRPPQTEQSTEYTWQQPTDWAGFYAGLNGGGAFGDSDVTTSVAPGASGYILPANEGVVNRAGSQSLNTSTLNYALLGGYNYQFENLIIGLEASFGGMNLKASQNARANLANGQPFVLRQSMETHWLFTARPRLGYNLGRFLVYATGGYALTDMQYHANYNDCCAQESSHISKNLNGWLAGGGFEYQFATAWSLRAEYLYMGFQSVSTTSTNLQGVPIISVSPPPIPTYPQDVFSHKIKFSAQVVNFSLNYRF
jgi:outer membrane immunogenic protein